MYKEIMLTLPKEKGSLTEYLYQYKGFWFESGYGLEGTMWMQEQHFKARSDDIFLITYPKCGATWFKALIFSIMNRTRYDVSKHPLLYYNPHDCFPFLELRLFGKTPVGDPELLPSPRLLATHVPCSLLPESVINSAASCRIVYVVRDPKDVFVSLFHFSNKLRSMAKGKPNELEEAFDMFSKGVSLYGPFWDHVIEYWKASLEFPERILFLKYEEMKNNPLENTKKLAEFLGRPFSSEEEDDGRVKEIIDLCSFEKMSNLEVNKRGALPVGIKNEVFFREGKVGDSKNHLSPQMIECVDEITKLKLGSHGLNL